MPPYSINYNGVIPRFFGSFFYTKKGGTVFGVALFAEGLDQRKSCLFFGGYKPPAARLL
jgi:hypothetical protein